MSMLIIAYKQQKKKTFMFAKSCFGVFKLM